MVNFIVVLRVKEALAYLLNTGTGFRRKLLEQALNLALLFLTAMKRTEQPERAFVSD
jgi:hypothetical protein